MCWPRGVRGTDVFWAKISSPGFVQTTRVNETTTPTCAYNAIRRPTVTVRHLYYNMKVEEVGYPIWTARSDERGGAVHRRLSFDHPMAVRGNTYTAQYSSKKNKYLKCIYVK